MITILSYIILRLFVPEKNYTLEEDELRYITTARNFYKLWNKSTYDMHPPLYAFFIKYLKSGVMVSFLCSIGLYFVSVALYSALELTTYQKTIALTFLAFNYTLIYYSNRVFRYQLIALLGTVTIYLMVTHAWLSAGMSWGLLGLTCSFAGLRGFFIWVCLGLNWISLLSFGAVYSIWLFAKIKVYVDNEYYPSGIDGRIERVKDFTLKQLLSPQYFNWTYEYYGKRELGYDLKNWHRKIGGIFGLYQTKIQPVNIIINLLTLVVGFFTIKGALVSPWWITTITMVLLYPSLLKRFLPRNSIIAIPLLGFMLAKGLPIVPEVWLFWGVLCLCFGFLCFQRAFIFTKPKIKAFLVGQYLDSLPRNGVLCEGIIANSVAYRTKKRVVVLPHDNCKENAIYQTNLSIEKFNLNYAVFSNLWMKDIHLGYPAIDYIKKFQWIKTIMEDNDFYYIYDLSAHSTT